jgi:crossover junction endodeoxyribonuclease RuvC
MRFLGIDQSLNGTGLCVLSDVGQLVTSATVTPDELRDGERLVFVKTAVASVLADVEFATMEGYSYNSVGRVFELGEIGGVIKVLLVERKIPYVVVPPILLKKFATGTTHASKEAMLAAAVKRGHDFGENDDQADAFFLAHVALAYAKNTPNHRCEMDVLRALRNPPKDKKNKRRARRLIKNAI